jgi:hypothetical protein
MKVKAPTLDRISLEQIANNTNEVINSESFLQAAKKNPQDFTRKRKLPFIQLILFLLNFAKSSTQVALNRFFKLFPNVIISASQQALSKARRKISWSAFKFLFLKNVETIYSHGYAKWHNYRILAIDGSKIKLPKVPKLKDFFGTFGDINTSVTPQGSILYDVLNNYVLHGLFYPIQKGERALAMLHIEFLRQLSSFNKELIILDRGYPSFELINFIESMSIYYIMRVKTKFNILIDEMGLGCHNFVLEDDGKEIKCRIIKFKLPNNEIETLITNVFDYNLGIKHFKELYFLRWSVETEFKKLKEILEIENFSSRTVEGVLQDFYITLIIANITSVAANYVQPIIDEERKFKKNKYKYKINLNLVVGIFRDTFILLLIEADRDKIVSIIKKIIDQMTKKLTPIRPDRSNPRSKSRRTQKFPHNHKSNC